MGVGDPRTELQRYLQIAREALVWKLDGLSEYDARRPLVPTGTNLLGLVKHVAGVEAGYLGETFGRPLSRALPWLDDGAEPNADMWATADEPRQEIIDLYRAVWAHSDATIEALELDAPGTVPWWPAEANPVSLHRILVHLIAETNRHAGHADLVRELIDGAAGLRADAGNLPDGDAAWWTEQRLRLERVAVEAGERQRSPVAVIGVLPAGRPRGTHSDGRKHSGGTSPADRALRPDMTGTPFDPHALLAASRLGVLATIKADGRPQLSPVTPFYDRPAGLVYVSMTVGRAKTTNLRRDRRATLEVTSPDGLAWATVEGTATLTGPGTDADGPEVQALVDYYRLAAGEHPDWDEYRSVMVSDRRVLMTMTVDHVYGARIG